MKNLQWSTLWNSRPGGPYCLSNRMLYGMAKRAKVIALPCWATYLLVTNRLPISNGRLVSVFIQHFLH